MITDELARLSDDELRQLAGDFKFTGVFEHVGGFTDARPCKRMDPVHSRPIFMGLANQSFPLPPPFIKPPSA
jgi:hypothetical protein